jgi:hypothetical protein
MQQPDDNPGDNWLLHERFHNIRLPDALAFFGGTRFVPIVTTVVLGPRGSRYRSMEYR